MAGSNPPPSPFFQSYQDFDSFASTVLSKLVEGNKTAGTFPVDEDYNYYKALRPFASKMKDNSNRLLGLVQRLIDKEKPSHDVKLVGAEDADAASELFNDGVIDIIDGLVEQVAIFIDEAKGKRDSAKQLTVSKTATISQQGKPDFHLFYGSGIPRPQDKWKDDIDNSYEPFIPKITTKPFGKTPLDKVFLEHAASTDGPKRAQPSTSPLSKDMESHLSNMGLSTQVQKTGGYSHPYETELRTITYVPEQLEVAKEQAPKSLEEVKYLWVDTPEKLQQLVSVLGTQKEIAIDLEHHAYRTYQGLTCLMQISTRTEDYIVDTLELWKHMNTLAGVFANPQIVKVLHGADMDVQWLQRDFGIYIVNLFDTGQASRVLDFPSYSLAFLLKHYCSVIADKKYQLADWRLRPLPDEMVKYAREDTHYLLYIYDKIKNEVLARSNESKQLLHAVLNRSRDICLTKYEKEELTEESYLKLYNKYNVVYNPQQLRVFSSLYNWRDRTARTEDESTRYVLPNHMLFHIADMMPEDMDSLLGCCNPVPPLIRVHTQDILLLIKKAKASVAPLPGVPQDIRGMPMLATSAQRTPESFGLAAVGGATYPTNNIPANGGRPGTATSQEFVTINSTEQLIKEAGWIDSDDMGSAIPQREATLAPANQNMSASNPLHNSIFGQPEEESSDEETRESRQTAEAIRRSFAVDLFANIKIPDTMDTTGTSSTSGVLGVRAEEPFIATANAFGAAPPGFGLPELGAAGAATASTGNLGEFDNIPQSMAEIYKLSTKNKKRKKKKDTKEDTVGKGPQSPFYLNDGTEEIDIRAAKRLKSAETTASDEDSVKFMREIGWIGAGEDTPPRLHNSASQRSKVVGSQATNAGDQGDDGFAPYDYSKHAGDTTPASTSGAFNPYGASKFGSSRGRGGRGGGHQGGGNADRGRGGHRRAVSGGSQPSKNSVVSAAGRGKPPARGR